jgi:membrane fusion protein (multidrug efflux system)
MTAAESPWQPQVQSVGSVVAINGADLSSEVSGIVDTINFQSGDQVKAGQVLVTLRPNNDPAVLAQLQATAAVDKSNYLRDKKQFSADAVSQAQVDSDQATYLAAQAQVAAQQALMDEKIIRAPFAGTIGIRQVNIGQYLPAGTNVVTLQQLDPLFVDFYVPQQALSVVKPGDTANVTIDAFPDQTFVGQVVAINSAIDTATRTVQVRAQIRNPQNILRPGMFASIAINTGQPQNYITLPQTAITYNPYGDTVFLLHNGTGPDGKPALLAQQKFVQLGDTRGDQVAVTSGIAPGDTVVTTGQLKLSNGSNVIVNNSVPVPDDANPNPPNQ